MDSINTKIADTGLHGHVDKQIPFKQICGLRHDHADQRMLSALLLILQCLDADPSNRSTASQLYECLGNWTVTICDDPDPSDLSNQFDVAEEIRFSSLE
ncbi:hypothetical protein RhiirA5_445061 [Rhizophagus irregularis]|uniref:Uncharacterized protein n=1 Tax=Rhizophagus irregularis TaxID=588596 RepID=A0A2I1FNL3_9GLOM|nr:hypothetical protein RhiirA5_445061 [Rhizophagus irregularis]PKY35943.1 hypothetical protein RhiirB3_457581 [Rhizophagus irregularis]